MKAISLFSGVGGFELGFDRAGIDTVLQVEIDETCRAVLERHWPETERIADVREVRSPCGGMEGCASDGANTQRREAVPEHPDLIYGGFPCQDLSVAGKRAGLGGERSGLWYEFERVVSELRPRWVVAENVPGLLSSGSCPCSLCEIAEGRIKAHIEQHGDAEGTHDCAECRAGFRLLKAHRATFRGADFAIIIHALEELGYCVGWAVLDAQHFGVPQRRRRVFIVAGPSRAGVQAVLSLCESCGGNPETSREAGEAVAGTLGGGSSERGWCSDTDRTTFIAQPVTTRPYADGGGDENRNLIADTVRSHPRPGSNTTGSIVAASLRSRSSSPGVNPPGRGGEDDENLVTDPIAQTLGARDYKGAGSFRDGSIQAHQMVAGQVRRLTPLECERLQGWPDDWTRWAADGSEVSDSQRYRMIGNGVASPVAEWIGHRLVAVDSAGGKRG